MSKEKLRGEGFILYKNILNKEEISFLNSALEKDLIYFEYP